MSSSTLHKREKKQTMSAKFRPTNLQEKRVDCNTPETDVLIFKIFSPKNSAKNWRF
jgi:hypothetical protein